MCLNEDWIFLWWVACCSTAVLEVAFKKKITCIQERKTNNNNNNINLIYILFQINNKSRKKIACNTHELYQYTDCYLP